MNGRIGMYPTYSNSQWERQGNPHLQFLQMAITAQGYEVVSVPLADVLRPKRLSSHNIDILHIHWPGAIVDYFVQFRTQVVPLKGVVQKLVNKISKVLTRVSQNSICRDITRWFVSGRVRRWVSRIDEVGIPIVWQVHDLHSHHYVENGFGRYVDELLHHELFRIAKALIVHEESCMVPVKDKYGEKELIGVARLGSYKDVYGEPVSKIDARIRLKIPVESRVICYIGTARPNRNPRNIVNAFTTVGSNTDILIVAGIGVHAYIDTNCKNVIIFDEFLSPDKIRDVYCAADFVVNDGSKYLTSAVIRTSMSYGVPVVVCPYGSAIDMAKGAAVFIQKDPEGLVRAIREALNASEKTIREMGGHALKRDAERDWSDAGPACANIYQQVLWHNHG